MKKTLKVTAVCVALALAFAGCKEAPDDDDDKLSAPKVGSADDLDWAGGTVPATEAAAIELYTDASDAMGYFIVNEVNGNASVRGSLAAIRPLVATIGENDNRNYDKNYPIDFEESINGGTVRFTGNVREKGTYNDINEEDLTKNTTYPLLTYLEDATVDGTITNVTIEDDGVSYTFNGKTKNEANVSLGVTLKTGSKDDLSDSTFKVTGEFALAFGNAFSVKRASDGAGAKFILTYAANYGPKSWVFGLDEDSEAMNAFAKELSTYLQNQETTLYVYDEQNNLKYKIQITGGEALGTSLLY